MAIFDSGFPTFGALHWESATNQLWVVCDNNYQGRSRLFEVDSQGSFVAVADYERPTGMAQPQQRGLHHPAGRRVRRRQQAGLLG